MTQDQLVALCREWQAILRLQDWDVSIAYARVWDMHSPKCFGQSTVNEPLRRSRILIRDPIDDDPKEAEDLEDTIVHELLHLHTWRLRELAGGGDSVAEEQAISSLAGAFVKLKRAIEPAGHEHETGRAVEGGVDR